MNDGHTPHATTLPRPMRRRQWMCALVVAGAALAAPAKAQDFPTRPITIVIPFSPGGPDRIVRLVADRVSASLKQPIVIDYKPGATGLIGAAFVQRAAPDGYTLLFSGNSSMVVAPMLRQPAPFDVLRDFAPVTTVMRYPMFLIAPPRLAANTVGEFVAAAKANPSATNYGSPGIGSVGQLTTEMFARAAGLSMAHVPYKGIGDAQAGVMAGDVQLYLDGPLSSAELLRGGRVKALAVTGDRRVPAFPNVPSMKELGYPNVDALVWIGLFAPRGVPEPILRKLSDEFAKAVRADGVREQIEMGGLAEAVGGTPEQMARAIEAETPGFARLVKELNLRVE